MAHMRTSMMPFLESRDICIQSVLMKLKDIIGHEKEKTFRRDNNFLNLVIRNAVLSTGTRSIKGFEFHRLIQKIKQHVTNLDADNKVLMSMIKKQLLGCIKHLKKGKPHQTEITGK
ncbi:uncharacterized protein LOC117322190 [Pecten maximus]|uniref:uncharacterized protein LOC117322190 n=1 Tax=Pecten maximus TaxID=6579 RepID=UPI0014584C36|nr:uncharacterized protein LOC117322190 [Pecten maximus]